MSKGIQLVTADAAVGSAGTAVAIYGLHVISGVGGGAVVTVKTTDGSGTVQIKHTGTASTGSDLSFGGVGLVFPSGAFIDVEAIKI